jgi:hypothetical protein
MGSLLKYWLTKRDTTARTPPSNDAFKVNSSGMLQESLFIFLGGEDGGLIEGAHVLNGVNKPQTTSLLIGRGILVFLVSNCQLNCEAM